MTKSLSIDQIKKIRPLIPSVLALIYGLWASSIFHFQGEADAQAPVFFGLGIAIFWRLRRPGVINGIIRWSALVTFSIFTIERSLPHAVWRAPDWVDVAYSPSLFICGVTVHLVGLLSWFIDHALRQEETSHPDPDMPVLPSQNLGDPSS